MSLRIYNTLTNQKEDFKPITSGAIGLYVCGMTVYDLCHLGHARVMISFDMIYRYLKSQNYDVHYVRNITDIDDKILARSKRDNIEFHQLINTMISEMDSDFEVLNLLDPDKEPRVTEYIPKIIALVEKIIDRGHAYVGDNKDVYFRVRSFEGYGKLSGRNIDELRSGERIDVDPNKEDPLDFVLWKHVTDDSISYPSPWGNGRPGWHIECSAMSMDTLGETFDIHGGGPDLKFPHHDNEIAQSESATGKPYANNWMHVGPLLVDGKKMSKSLNNFYTIRDLLVDYDPDVLRMFVLASHYRSGVDFSIKSVDDAKKKLGKIYNSLRFKYLHHGDVVHDPRVSDLRDQFHDAMQDDFNTPQALSVLFEVVSIIEKEAVHSDLVLLLGELMDVLGFKTSDVHSFFEVDVNVSEIESLISDRKTFKALKEYERADEVRLRLEEKGVRLKDSSNETTWEYIY